MIADIDRLRAARIMRERGLDAIVLAKPESFRWATGAPPGVAAFFRRAGAALALVPADTGLPVSAVCTELFAPATRKALGEDQVFTHPDWVETADIRPWADSAENIAQLVTRAHRAAGRQPGFQRPAAYDATAAFEALKDLLQRERLLKARIGLDLDFWPAADYSFLRARLPQTRWRDASEAVAQIKVIKSATELDRLSQAASLAEAGLQAALRIIQPGVHRDEIADAWREGARRAAAERGARLTGLWEYITVGPLPWAGGGAIGSGDILKFDVGCLIDGYSSDSGRTFCLHHASARAHSIMAALDEAFQCGLGALRPGYLLSDVHARASAAMKRAGFDTFSRGHWGHSLGHDTFCEVAPSSLRRHTGRSKPAWCSPSKRQLMWTVKAALSLKINSSSPSKVPLRPGPLRARSKP